MPEMIRFSPLQKLDLSHEFKPDPNTLLHIVSGQAFAPTRAMRLWQVDEWTFRDHQGSQLFDRLAPRGRNKSVPHSGDVNEIVSLVISNDDGVETMRPRNVAADH